MRTCSRDDGLDPRDLLQGGIDHLSAADALFRGPPAHYDSAGYLAHMGFELLLKSWLLSAEKDFERTHSLNRLYERLRGNHGAPELNEKDAKLLRLLDQYEKLRYPNRKAPTEVGTEDWGHARLLADKIKGWLPKETWTGEPKDELVRKGGRVLMKKSKPAD